MSGTANHRPDRPIESFPVAELPPAPPEGAAGEGAVAATPAKLKPPEVAVLRFLDPSALSIEVPLAFPFEWDGREVRSVTVRRLASAEVGQVMAQIPDDEAYDLYSFIAAMTGLPAPVLRGMIDDDGAEVIERARPLLPRSVATVFYDPISEPGADTSSRPPKA